MQPASNNERNSDGDIEDWLDNSGLNGQNDNESDWETVSETDWHTERESDWQTESDGSW